MVYAVTVNGDKVYAGGDFTDADRIAMWNGVSWQALGSGLNGTVEAIAVNGNDV